MPLKRGYSHIIPVTPSLALRSADDVTIDWRWRHDDQTIATWTRDNWYLTRLISILFTAIFTTGRVRRLGYSLQEWWVGQEHVNNMNTTSFTLFVRNIHGKMRQKKSPKMHSIKVGVVTDACIRMIGGSFDSIYRISNLYPCIFMIDYTPIFTWTWLLILVIIWSYSHTKIGRCNQDQTD